MPYLHKQHLQQMRQPPAPGESSEEETARLKGQYSTVKRHAEQMYRSTPARSTEDEAFYAYELCVESVIFSGTYSNIYLATHEPPADFPLVGRVYEPSARIDPHRSSFMRVLHSIGEAAPGCIPTLDIFYDDAGRVVIFQEFAMHGNMKDYLHSNNVYVPEEQMHDWATQIYQGLDYLGDHGICHRAINPKHILLTPMPGDQNKTLAKLGSFRDSFIYFDPKEGRIRTQTTRKANDRVVSNFQAPEVYFPEAKPAGGGGQGQGQGQAADKAPSLESRVQERGNSQLSRASGARDAKDGETFDPIMADIWSYGATFFYATTRTYAYRHKNSQQGKDPTPDIEKAINSGKHLSADAKDWFRGLLHGDPEQRSTFDQIAANEWFKNGPAKAGEKKQAAGGGKGSGSGGVSGGGGPKKA